jgi:carbonic anhydrase
MSTQHHCPGVPRRSFLSGVAAAAVAAAFADFAAVRPAFAQTILTPDAALQRMMDGNARYVGQRFQAFNDNLSILRADTEEKQEPFAAVLSCADSRVPVEILFDQSIGHLFVTRVAGNVATPEIIASLEYGAVVLGTAAIVVLGHGHCGAVKAAIAGKEVPGQISVLYAPLRAAVDRAGPDLEAAIRANAQIQAKLLSEASPALAGLIKAGKLKVVAGYYDLVSGKVELLG